VEAPKDPDNCNLFAISSLFLSEDEEKDLAQRYRAGGLKYGEVKKDLVERIWEFFSPYRERREALLADQDRLHAILEKGADKARAVADKTIAEVRKRTGLRY
jgi:tryptophanyl-tRNA synthetase